MFACVVFFFFFQAEDGIRDLVRSRGLGDVYKRQVRVPSHIPVRRRDARVHLGGRIQDPVVDPLQRNVCLLYTSDAADDLLCVDLGGRRIIKKKKKKLQSHSYPQ